MDTKIDKLRRLDVLREKLNGHVIPMVCEFHKLSQEIYGDPLNTGRNKTGWSVADTAKALNKSEAYVRNCLHAKAR